MRRCHNGKHENSRARCMLPPLLGERAGVMASVFSNLILGAGGGFRREKHFRLVTSAATALAMILELALPGQITKLLQCAAFSTMSPDHRKLCFGRTCCLRFLV